MYNKETDNLPEPDCIPGCLHPRRTYNLVGHRDAEKLFIKSLDSGRMHHGWLVTGVPGIGKATLAYRMIRYALGGKPLLPNSLDVPKTDIVSQKLESLGHGNFKLIRIPYDYKTKKLRTEIPVNSIRELSDFFRSTAAEDNALRVCLIDSADNLNLNSQNALLKLLEEPPARSLVILLSASPGRLLPTIRSRCIGLSLKSISDKEIESWLSSRVNASQSVIDNVVPLSRGAPGKAISLYNNFDRVIKPLGRYLKGLSNVNSSLDFNLINDLALIKNRSARKLFWEALQDTLHSQAIHSCTGDWKGAFEPIKIIKTSEEWQLLWRKTVEMQQLETKLNMDKKTALVDILNAIGS
ncbi:MAG: DNA polymerase III subunit delta' [Hellea sp.]|nr:DNA polymerase III subunit delta' [Hellea sp.]